MSNYVLSLLYASISCHSMCTMLCVCRKYYAIVYAKYMNFHVKESISYDQSALKVWIHALTGNYFDIWFLQVNVEGKPNGIFFNEPEILLLKH